MVVAESRYLRPPLLSRGTVSLNAIFFWSKLKTEVPPIYFDLPIQKGLCTSLTKIRTPALSRSCDTPQP